MRINALGNTVTDFASDDYIALDGATNGSRKMKNDSLLKVTAQNALAGNVAPAFDPTRTISNPYKAWKDSVVYDGVTYLFTADHYGAWDASHVVTFDKLIDKFRKLDNDVGVYDIGTTHNTLDSTYSRVMAVFPIKDVDSTFVWKITNKSTNGNVNIRLTSAPTPYGADLVKSIETIIAADTEGNGEFTIDAGDKANAKYVIFLNATINLVVSFDLEFITTKSLAYNQKQISDVLGDITGTDGQPW